MNSPPPWSSVFRDLLGILTFRASRDTLQSLGGRHLVVGLASTWLVGIGRYWDHPEAKLPQYLGIGSVLYVLLLGSALWLVTRALSPKDWQWRRVVTFVALTSPPAILYAIPVERFLDTPTAATVNVWFLGVVALWRVALLYGFFLRLGRLGLFVSAVATLLPISVIVVALALLNLEHVVFDIMAGIQDESANADAYQVVWLLAISSFYLAPVTILAYLVAVYVAVSSDVRQRRAERAGSVDPGSDEEGALH